jgi:hypothetical protein
MVAVCFSRDPGMTRRRAIDSLPGGKTPGGLPAQKSEWRFLANLLSRLFKLLDSGSRYLNSIKTTSNGLSLRFSGRCSSAGIIMLSPAFQLRSSVRPSGKVNLPWLLVRNTATREGCPCITDFSFGPYLARITRTRSCSASHRFSRDPPRLVGVLEP